MMPKACAVSGSIGKCCYDSRCGSNYPGCIGNKCIGIVAAVAVCYRSACRQGFSCAGIFGVVSLAEVCCVRAVDSAAYGRYCSCRCSAVVCLGVGGAVMLNRALLTVNVPLLKLIL